METNHDLRCPEHVLYLHHWDERYERAAVRWLGRLLAERPALGLGRAAEAADSPAISSAHGQFLATRCTREGMELPCSRDPFELMDSAVLEREAGAHDEIFHGG